MPLKTRINKKLVIGRKNINKNKLAYIIHTNVTREMNKMEIAIDKNESQPNNFQKFLQENRNIIRNIVQKNPTVITKNDEWRNENEWDEMYEMIKK